MIWREIVSSLESVWIVQLIENPPPAQQRSQRLPRLV